MSGVTDLENMLVPSELKAVMWSKRANIFYLEYCRVMQKDGRVLYLCEGKKENLYYNIPIANTTVILLGTGTSITQAAVRMLSAAGVLIGFCGGGGTPLFAGAEVEWLSPQSEYRPTEYVQAWLSFWFDEAKRLAAAKEMQISRCDYLVKRWSKDRELNENGFYSDDMEIEKAVKGFKKKIVAAGNVTELLVAEAAFSKELYKYAAQQTQTENFVRDPKAGDTANDFLNHGNYLAYGLGAVTLWVLGIPHGFALMHGKTRRGALVFDVADLVKDTIVLPWAFICAAKGMREQEFRQCCLQKFTEHGALDFMFDEIKRLSKSFERQMSGNDGAVCQPE